MKNSTTTQQLHSGKLANNQNLSRNYFYMYNNGSYRTYLNLNISKQYLKLQAGIRPAVTMPTAINNNSKSAHPVAMAPTSLTPTA